TMGLAPYGGENRALAGEWIARSGTRFDFSRFHEWLVASGDHKLVSFESRDKALIQQGDAISREARGPSSKGQHAVEGALLHLARQLHEKTGAKALCLAGGVALNSVANGLIAAKGPFEKVFVQPAAHDSGQAIGLAYQGHLLVTKQPIVPITDAFGGK